MVSTSTSVSKTERAGPGSVAAAAAAAAVVVVAGADGVAAGHGLRVAGLHGHAAGAAALHGAAAHGHLAALAGAVAGHGVVISTAASSAATVGHLGVRRERRRSWKEQREAVSGSRRVGSVGIKSKLCSLIHIWGVQGGETQRCLVCKSWPELLWAFPAVQVPSDSFRGIPGVFGRAAPHRVLTLGPSGTFSAPLPSMAPVILPEPPRTFPARACNSSCRVRKTPTSKPIPDPQQHLDAAVRYPKSPFGKRRKS